MKTLDFGSRLIQFNSLAAYIELHPQSVKRVFPDNAPTLTPTCHPTSPMPLAAWPGTLGSLHFAERRKNYSYPHSLAHHTRISLRSRCNNAPGSPPSRPVIQEIFSKQ
jgi:hypothetical protein